jgi:hypothetical protein
MRATELRFFRRLQAVLLVARGFPVAEVARITGAKPDAVYHWLRLFLRTHAPAGINGEASMGPSWFSNRQRGCPLDLNSSQSPGPSSASAFDQADGSGKSGSQSWLAISRQISFPKRTR